MAYAFLWLGSKLSLVHPVSSASRTGYVHMRMQVSIKQTTSEHVLIFVYVTPCSHIPLRLCIVLFLISLRLSWLIHGWSRNVALLPVVPAYWQKTISSREHLDNSRTFPINRRPATLTA
jgi:hypothetical protein